MEYCTCKCVLSHFLTEFDRASIPMHKFDRASMPMHKFDRASISRNLNALIRPGINANGFQPQNYLHVL